LLIRSITALLLGSPGRALLQTCVPWAYFPGRQLGSQLASLLLESATISKLGGDAMPGALQSS
jgi:hypothetical protein